MDLNLELLPTASSAWIASSGVYRYHAVILNSDWLPGAILPFVLLLILPGYLFGIVSLYMLWMDWDLRSTCRHHLHRNDLYKVYRYLPLLSDTWFVGAAGTTYSGRVRYRLPLL